MAVHFIGNLIQATSNKTSAPVNQVARDHEATTKAKSATTKIPASSVLGHDFLCQDATA
jgi:hypothetical protein